MIFSPSTGAYKQVGGFKAIFDIFQVELGNFLDHHGIIIDYAWCNELIAYSGTDGGHVMFFYYEIISGKKPSDKF
jgi:regulator of sigma E protease